MHVTMLGLSYMPDWHSHLHGVLQIFLTHLHSDHISDLPPLYAVGFRKKPLEVWGPSGQYPNLGLNATLEGLKAVSDILSTDSVLTSLPTNLL